MRSVLPRVLLGLALLVSGPLPVWAETGESGEASVPEWAEDGRNHLAVFVGVTDGGGDTGPSLGIDYEYRLTHLFGIGGTIEYTGADLREGVIAVSFDWHVWKEMKLFIAPGVEIDAADGSDSFLVRLGIEYGFDIGKGWEVAPALNFDFTSDEDSIVIGAGFGRSF
jgi:hypothetical protein